MASTWCNWAGNQQAQPVAVEHPRDTEEVALLVKQAAASGRHVKAVGAAHSFTGAAVTDGVLLSLDRMDGVVAADTATGLVTVQAGIPLHRLNRALAGLGLAMSNLGDIDRQSIAGATSTGTHGTGRGFGGLATQIRGLEIVVGDGSVVTCSATESPALFECARVGLGALGIITAVTLQCEPAFTLMADERPMPLTEVVERFDDLADSNTHFEFYWFPHTDVALTKRNNRMGPDEAPRPLRRWRGWLDDEFFSNTVFGAVCALGRRRDALVPRLNRTAAKVLGARRYSAPSHEVFTSPRRVRFVEMEYAVPRTAALDAVRAVQRVIDRDGLRISFPIEVRVAAADDIPLSTAYGRDSAYVAIHRYRGEPFEGYFRAVEQEMRALDGRPHWGKMHWRTHEDLRPVVPALRRLPRRTGRGRPRSAVRQRLPRDGARTMTSTYDLQTPALVVDRAALEANLALMADALPGPRLRPHVKAHKSTALARLQAAAGHHTFTCATIREVEGMAAAGLGADLLLANEVLDTSRLGRVVAAGARVTVAVDSDVTVRAAAAGGVREVVVDVNVGLPRCGCAPDDAGRLADEARSLGLTVRGVMGYEGHLMTVPDPADRTRQTEECMARLLAAHEEVGGDIVSAGGTGTYAVNTWANEIQAGSYVLMDTAYGALPDLPFAQALFVVGTVISHTPPADGIPGWCVTDVGLKSLGMDHGNPSVPGGTVWFCSDEHVTWQPDDFASVSVGDRVRVLPAHVDPTIALHERMWVVDDDDVVDELPVDLRGW